MASEPPPDKTPAEIEDRVWDLAKKIDICMFVTWDGTQQRARPLSARVFRDEHRIYFLVDESGGKNDEIEKYPTVTMCFADTGSMKFVTIAGEATVSNDRAKIQELWGATDKAWWDDATDPAIRLLTVVPDNAELWDSPNKLVAVTAMLTAAVTGAKPKMGDHGEVNL